MTTVNLIGNGPKEENLSVGLASANRAPERFANPDVFEPHAP